jgi:hypothetical protein
MSFAEGACVGVPVLTAHRNVFAAGPVTGKVVLVTGGAGAVGLSDGKTSCGLESAMLSLCLRCSASSSPAFKR